MADGRIKIGSNYLKVGSRYVRIGPAPAFVIDPSPTDFLAGDIVLVALTDSNIGSLVPVNLTGTGCTITELSRSEGVRSATFPGSFYDSSAVYVVVITTDGATLDDGPATRRSVRARGASLTLADTDGASDILTELDTGSIALTVVGTGLILLAGHASRLGSFGANGVLLTSPVENEGFVIESQLGTAHVVYSKEAGGTGASWTYENTFGTIENNYIATGLIAIAY